MGRFTLAASMDTAGYGATAIYYWGGKQSKEVQTSNIRIRQKDGGQGRKYYMIRLTKPTKTNRMRSDLTTSSSIRNTTMVEIRLF